MEFCKCCGKLIKEDSLNGWHKSCIKKFFKKDILPNEDEIKKAIDNIEKDIKVERKSVSGVQKKLSSHLFFSIKLKKTVMGKFEYILKPDTDDFNNIAEAENLVMCMANISKINTVEHGLLNYENRYIYLTKRIDRNGTNKIHMEDFCQLSQRPTDRKYDGSYEQCGKILDKYSTAPKLDKTNFLEELIFCFLIGNSDMHLKNFSLIETDESNRLSPAYDLLPVNIIYKKDKDFTALNLNGKKKNQTRNDFLKLSEALGINSKITLQLIDRLCSYREKYFELIDNSELKTEFKDKFKKLIDSRIKRLNKEQRNIRSLKVPY